MIGLTGEETDGGHYPPQDSRGRSLCHEMSEKGSTIGTREGNGTTAKVSRRPWEGTEKIRMLTGKGKDRKSGLGQTWRDYGKRCPG